MVNQERNGLIGRARKRKVRRTIRETPNLVDIPTLNKLLRSVYGSPESARKRFQSMWEADLSSIKG
jgi:hypothetical protein